jgi:protein TonB
MTANVTFPTRYGAAELEASYNRNLALAFLIALGTVGLGFALYTLFHWAGWPVNSGFQDNGGTTTIVLPPVPPQRVKDPVSTTSRTSGGPHAISPAGGLPGTLGPIKIEGGLPEPGTLPSPNGFTFNGQDPHGSTIGGGNDDTLHKGGDGKDRKGRSATTNDVGGFPDDTTFVFVEKNASFDERQLEHAIEYPEMARRAGVEGNVTLRVLIDREGKPVRTIVDHSDNALLVDAAVKAVTSIVYTPAIQNHMPVAVWIQIPVSFSLNR